MEKKTIKKIRIAIIITILTLFFIFVFPILLLFFVAGGIGDYQKLEHEEGPLEYPFEEKIMFKSLVMKEITLKDFENSWTYFIKW